MFEIKSPYKPTIAQQKAIDELAESINKDNKHTILLGVTGSGKTFVAANLIKKINRPTLILAHNKTLAGQLYQEYRDFFPNNAIEYFVSYYDYYQPESYMPTTDTYIDKDASINEEIDKLRLSTTTSLLTRPDVVVVSSVSCIYALGSPEEYKKQLIRLVQGQKIRQKDLILRLNHLQYTRNDFDFARGSFRVKGDTIDVYLAYQHYAVRIECLENKITNLSYFDPLTGETFSSYENELNNPRAANGQYTKSQEDYLKANNGHSKIVSIFPAKHYIAPEQNRDKIISKIRSDMIEEVKNFKALNKDLEAHRLMQRTNYDLEMIQEIGFCKGIENYSRYFDGRKEGERPYTLLDFFPENYLIIVDESHITIPQIRGMYNGDRARKQTLIDYGFRLQAAKDNRPLKFEEFERLTKDVVYTSATPGPYEKERSLIESQKNQTPSTIELLVRPTGIIDPYVEIIPTQDQILDLEQRVINVIEKDKARAIITTLTKRMAEELSEFLKSRGYKVAYLHGDVETLERAEILTDLRSGIYDILIGINLLREGIDLPEVALVAILDADKEGFLRSSSSLIQIMGRGARHLNGRVVMYADKLTDSMKKAIDEVDRRREYQIQYNKINNITPTSISKPIKERILEKEEEQEELLIDLEPFEFKILSKKQQKEIMKETEKKMKEAAKIMKFETAAKLRDELTNLKRMAK